MPRDTGCEGNAMVVTVLDLVMEHRDVTRIRLWDSFAMWAKKSPLLKIWEVVAAPCRDFSSSLSPREPASWGERRQHAGASRNGSPGIQERTEHTT